MGLVPEDERFERSLRPGRRSLAVGLALNVVLVAALLVYPYFRGRARADEVRARTVALARCLWGGEPVASPGLGLPPGEREAYASLYLTGGRRWPGRCAAPLRRVAPDEASLLLPAVAQAEDGVRRAVALVEGHLGETVDRAPTAPIPSAPRLAMLRLLAAVAVLARESGADDRLTDPMFSLRPRSDRLAEPTRVPIEAAENAGVTLRVRGDGFEAIAVDSTGISWVRIGGGRMHQHRARRSQLLRGVVPGPDGAWLVWATPEERCAGDPAGCATRATGLAPLAGDADELPEPRWLGGHPAGRIDLALRVVDGAALLLARTAEGVEARRYDLAAAPPAEGPLGPVASQALPPHEAAAFAGSEVVLLGPESLTMGDPWAGTTRTLGPGGRGTLRSCGPFITREISPEPTQVEPIEGDAAPGAFLETGEVVLDPGDPRRDGLKLVCDAERLVVIRLRADGELGSARCDRAARCETRFTRIASDVERFDAVMEEGVTFVAWSGRGERRQTVVARLGSQPVRPASCFTMERGFCGPPLLAARSGRVLLGAREGTDLLLVESVDGGRSWRRASGLH